MKTMRKLFGIILATSMVITSISSMSITAFALQMATETIIANENFEGASPSLANWSIAAGMRTTIDKYAVATDPADQNNKVMELTYRGDTAKSGGTTNFQYSFTDIPNSGKLFISYRVKLIDTTNIITNNYPFVGLAAAPTGSTTGVTAAQIFNNGSASSGTLGVSKTVGGSDTPSNVTIGAGLTSSWTNFSYVIDFSTKEIKYYRAGVQINTTEHYYLYGTGYNTFDKIVTLRFYLRETAAWDGTKPDAKYYVDDIIIKRVPTLNVESDSTTTLVDPAKPMIKLNFATPVTKNDILNTLTIKDSTSNVVGGTKSVELLNSGKTAFVSLSQPLVAGATYTAEVNNTLVDLYGQSLATLKIIPITATKPTRATIALGRDIANETFEGTVNLTKWSRWGRPVTYGDSFAVGADPDNATNNVMVMTYKALKSASDVNPKNAQFRYAVTDIPNTGKLYIDYKFKIDDPSGLVRDNYSSLFVLSAGTSPTGEITATNLFHNGALANGRIVGKDLAGATKNIDFTPGFSNTWTNIVCVADFDTREIAYYRDGNALYTEKLYMPTGNLDRQTLLKFVLSEPDNWTGASEVKMYADNIKISRVPAFNVQSNVENTIIKQSTPITLSIANPMELSVLNNIIKLKQNGTIVPTSISLSADKRLATITPTATLNVNTDYLLTVDNVKDSFGQTLVGDAYAQAFTVSENLNYLTFDGTPTITPKNNGTTVALSAANQIEAKFTVRNQTEQAKDAFVAVAVYGDVNKLLGVQVLKLTAIPKNTNTDEKTLTVTNIANSSSVKIFLWDTEGKMIPYRIPVSN